jgi:CDGSH iron-sulfur domain-containing protein 3
MDLIPNIGLPRIAECVPSPVNVIPGKVYSWCSCGLTENGTFCDSNHKRVEGLPFRSVKVIFDKEEEILFCQCRQTSTPPFCDGRHISVKQGADI